jgi:2-polyprenyl-3-methyl-5-hydroxy-6-metoxy-1,4-benzoquinol methylase
VRPSVPLLRRAVKKLVSPLTTYGDRRFAGIHEHLDVAVGEDVPSVVDQRMTPVEARLTDLQQRFHDLQAGFMRMEEQVSIDTRTVAELGAAFRRSTDRIFHEVAALAESRDPAHPELGGLLRRALAGDRSADEQLAKLLRELVPAAADRIVGEHRHLPLEEMGNGVAGFLNWAAGHTGPAAQAGVWFNPPVTVLHTAGSVRPNDVNERIVEIPYAMGVAASIRIGGRVLDVGASESTVALSMASLGLEVFAADLRPHPLEHPLLTPVVGPIEEWEGPGAPLDAVFCISSIEHFGIGAYGEEGDNLDLDRDLVERCRTWLRPGGELVITTPYGRWQVDELQRTYDAPHLDALLEGWTLLDRRVCVQTGRATWEASAGEPDASTWDDGSRGVVLLRATPAS